MTDAQRQLLDAAKCLLDTRVGVPVENLIRLSRAIYLVEEEHHEQEQQNEQHRQEANDPSDRRGPNTGRRAGDI